MLQVSCHQFLILLERACIATHLHGKQRIAHSVRILACIRRCRCDKRLRYSIITCLLHDLGVILTAIGRRTDNADLIVNIMGQCTTLLVPRDMHLSWELLRIVILDRVMLLVRGHRRLLVFFEALVWHLHGGHCPLVHTWMSRIGLRFASLVLHVEQGRVFFLRDIR